MMKKTLINKQQGMTLLELVIVIVVIGIISGVAATKFGSSSSLTLSQQTQMFASHVRQMQSLAFNWGCDLTMVVDATSYSVTANGDYSGTEKAELCKDGSTQINLPGRFENFDFSLKHGVTFSTTGALYFDIKGQPTNIAKTAISLNTNFDLTDNINTLRVGVSPVTGFVVVSTL